MTEKQTNIKFLTIIGIIFILIISKSAIGQSQNALSLGGNKWGIAFGNPRFYNGLRIGLYNRYLAKIDANGIYTNKNYIENINGINVSLIYSYIETVNGISFSPINKVANMNGLQIGIMNKSSYRGGSNNCTETGSPKRVYGGKSHCLQIGLTNINISEINGIQISLFNNNKKLRGLGIGLINKCYNSSKSLQIGLINLNYGGNGVQLGIINYRKTNKWFAKILPIINLKIGKEKLK